MSEPQTPTATPAGLVVALKAKPGDKSWAALSKMGQVSPLAETGLLLVVFTKPHSSPRSAWSEVLKKCPEADWAAPVLKDADGNELYPTGSIVIRFRERLADKPLRAFAAGHGLVLERRNEFVPQQASFRPNRPRETYLPELIEGLAKLPDVAAAWAGTASRYRRA